MGKRQKLIERKVRKISDGSKIVSHEYWDSKKGDYVGYIQRFKDGKRVYTKKVRSDDFQKMDRSLRMDVGAWLSKTGNKMTKYLENKVTSFYRKHVNDDSK